MKHRLITFRRRGTTQNTIYYIHKSFILYTEVWLLSSGEVLEWLVEFKEVGVSDFKFPQQYYWRCWSGLWHCNWVFLKALLFLQNTGTHLPSNIVSHPKSESSRSRQDCIGFLILNLINILKRWLLPLLSLIRYTDNHSRLITTPEDLMCQKVTLEKPLWKWQHRNVWQYEYLQRKW
jgi:hypothetical protein